MSGVVFPTTDPVDFLVVGAGAAGGVVAKELATAGFRVVVLEQGPYLHEGDYSHDEIKYTIEPGLTNDPKIQPITFRKSETDQARRMKAIE
jgi:choline dehydrogenase-like flavoprotein